MYDILIYIYTYICMYVCKYTCIHSMYIWFAKQPPRTTNYKKAWDHHGNWTDAHQILLRANPRQHKFHHQVKHVGCGPGLYLDLTRSFLWSLSQTLDLVVPVWSWKLFVLGAEWTSRKLPDQLIHNQQHDDHKNGDDIANQQHISTLAAKVRSVWCALIKSMFDFDILCRAEFDNSCWFDVTNRPMSSNANTH